MNSRFWIQVLTLIYSETTLPANWVESPNKYGRFATQQVEIYVKLNTLRPRQNGCHFAEDIFKCIFLNDNAWFPIKISLKFVPKGLINNIILLVQIMAWRRPGDKPLSKPMIVSLPTHICVARPQWVTCNRTPWQYIKGLLRPSDRLLWSTITFLQSQSAFFFFENADFSNYSKSSVSHLCWSHSAMSCCCMQIMQLDIVQDIQTDATD